MRYMDVPTLVALLQREDLARCTRAIEIAATLPPDHRVGIVTQHAASTAVTMNTKYRMAESRGVKVDGLADVTEALEALRASMVAGCDLEGESDFALVFMNERLDRVLGVLHVVPGPAAS